MHTSLYTCECTYEHRYTCISLHVFTRTCVFIQTKVNTQTPSLIMCWICTRHMDATRLHVCFLFVSFSNHYLHFHTSCHTEISGSISISLGNQRCSPSLHPHTHQRFVAPKTLRVRREQPNISGTQAEVNCDSNRN